MSSTRLIRFLPSTSPIPHILRPTRPSCLPIPRQTVPFSHLKSSRIMATASGNSTTSQVISEQAKAEGGPSKGSLSAQMQSEATKQQNAEGLTAQNMSAGGAQDNAAGSGQNGTASQIISETAKAEGGPSKGSLSAQMQSQVTKQQNADGSGAQNMSAGGTQNTGSGASEASQVISETAKAEGGPSKGSLSAQMQSQVTKQQNAEHGGGDNVATGGAQNSSAVSGQNPPAGSAAAQSRSMADRQHNFEQAAQDVGAKLQNDPSSITQEDASYLMSRESRAQGGGRPPADSISAEAQRVAAANARGDDPTTVLSSSNTASSSASAGTGTGSGGAGGLDPTSQSQKDRMENFQQAAADVQAKINNDPSSVTKEDGDLMHSRETKAFGATQKGGVTSTAQHLAAQNEGATGGS